MRTLDKRRLRERMGELAPAMMLQIDRAISVSLGLNPSNPPAKKNDSFAVT